VQESSAPPVVAVPDGDALSDAVGRNAAADPDHVVVTRRVEGGWEGVTAKEFETTVRGVAAGLIARGVQAGDRVALMSTTRYEWTIADYAIWTAGAVTVPIYETSSAEQVEWIISDSGAVFAFVETPVHAGVVAEVRDRVPGLRDLVQFEGGGLDELTSAGADVAESEFAVRRATLSGDSLATIIYTSGTTGRPKGCEITHGNLLFDVRTTTADLVQLFDPKTSSTLMFLPIAHVFGRVIQVGCIENGVRLGHTSDVKNLVADFATFQPTFILSVPRVFEKIYNTSKQKAHGDGKGAIFDQAEKVAVDYSQALDAPGDPGLALKLRHAVFDRLVYAKLRAALGGKVSYAVSGGGPLGARLGHFYRGIGILILEGYGLTETSAGATVNTPEKLKIGSVGGPVPGVTVRIGDDGEILLKGRNVFRGYWQNPTATDEAIRDGWFHTGDIGELDGDGWLTITGRKKELIVTAGGKNVAPAVLEDRLRAHPLVSQCMVVGDNRPFIGVLVTLDPDFLGPWKTKHGKDSGTPIADLREDPELRAEIQGAVDDANKAVSKAESIKVFRILDHDFSEEGGEMTPSLKMKRTVIADHFDGDIEAIYAGRKPG